MIQAGEIQRIANAQGVRDTQIEKDYIIGWLLKGISEEEYLSEYLIFKGGTVLKKVWFADYRFSEDMDFTFSGTDWDIEKIEEALKKVCEWVYEESRIQLNLKPDEGSSDQYKCYVSYQGPLGGEKDIKFDISTNELVYFEVAQKAILDDYSDAEEKYETKSYSLEESLAEKLRCVIQRTIPRDLYDIWYLTEVEGLDIEDVAFGFQAKTNHKDFDPTSLMDALKAKEKKFRGGWEKSLKHQINDLPPFDEVWRDVLRNVRKVLDLLGS